MYLLNSSTLALYSLSDGAGWLSPHRVQKCAVVDESQEFVRSCHVVGYRFLSVVEKSVRSPDLTGQEVVQG